VEKTPIVIDTNIFIDHLRNYAPSVQFFNSLAEREDIYFSAITETELIAGKHNNDKQKREQLLHFLHRWNKVILTNQLALRAGDISREYNLDVPDAIIAATATSQNATLLTKNIKDFRKVKSLTVQEPY